MPVQVANQTRERGILDVTIDEQGRVDRGGHPPRPAPHLRLADSPRREGMALPAGDAEWPAREVPQNHPDHRHEALSRHRAVPGSRGVRGYATLPGVPDGPRHFQDHSGGCRNRRDGRCWPRPAGARQTCPRRRACAPTSSCRSRPRPSRPSFPGRRTLETILRQHELPAPLVQAAIESTRAVFNPRHLRAERPYRLVLSIDGLLKEFEYQIDADRFLRIVNRDRSTPEKLDAAVLLYEKETSVVTIRGRIDREHSSLIAAVDATGERVQLAISLAELFSGQIDFENDLQPGDAFEVLFETTKYDGAVRRLRSDSGRAVHQQRQGAPGVSLGASGDAEGRLLRRAGTIAAAVRARVAAAVHAARDVGILPPAHASGLTAPSGLTSASTMPPRRVRRSSRSRAASSSRRDGRAAAAGRSASATPAGSRATTCISRRLPRASAPARTSIRGNSSDASVRRAPPPVRTSTTGSGETVCSWIRAANMRASRPANRSRRRIWPTSAWPATKCCSSFRPRWRRSHRVA